MDWPVKNQTFYKILTSRIAFHLYFWGFFYLAYLAIVLMVFERNLLFSLTYSFCQIVLCSIPVYINFYALNKLFSQKKYFLYPIGLIALILVYAVLMWYFFVKFFNDKYSVYNYVFEIMWFIIVTTSIKYAKKSYEQKLEFQEMNSKQLQTELSLLKTQINPHFLFNTLNNLFGLARKQDPKTADGIAQLSHLMRYMIYDSNVDKIELEKEVKQVQRLIDLQKLRFTRDDDIAVDFNITGNIKTVQIPPMLLIPFVENAFKHGISLQKTSFLSIDLKINGRSLHFKVRNSIHKLKFQADESDSGIGLINVKRRLELLYPKAHDLRIHEDGKTFVVELILEG